MKPPIPFGIGLFLACAIGQGPGGPDPLDVLGRPKGRILLLGTIHFVDPGLDEYKSRVPFEPLSERRQREIGEVVDLLARYRPTKVAVERPIEGQGQLDEEYARFRRDASALAPTEEHQIGFRVAARVGLERVHAVDARGRRYEPAIDPGEWAKTHGQSRLVESEWYGRYLKAAQLVDEGKAKMPLREFLRAMNEPRLIRASHGVYLVGTFRVGEGAEYPGVDAKTAWYNRNLRIFANLQRITEREDERILLVIGAGHLPVLRHCVESSPEYELVEVSTYL